MMQVDLVDLNKSAGPQRLRQLVSEQRLILDSADPDKGVRDPNFRTWEHASTAY